MITITSEELDYISRDGQAIDNKAGYPAVVLHPDGTVSKFWARKKKLISSATLLTYSSRFVKNAAELSRRGIVTPEIISHTAVEKSHIKIVKYRSLPGKSIRELLKNDPQQVNITNLCQYIYKLHDKGILFRGIHLGNIIQAPDQQNYGLIDFTDVKFYSKALSLRRRATNLSTPLRYEEDTKRIATAGLPDLAESYLKILSASKSEEQKFRRQVTQLI